MFFAVTSFSQTVYNYKLTDSNKKFVHNLSEVFKMENLHFKFDYNALTMIFSTSFDNSEALKAHFLKISDKYNYILHQKSDEESAKPAILQCDKRCL